MMAAKNDQLFVRFCSTENRKVDNRLKPKESPFSHYLEATRETDKKYVTFRSVSGRESSALEEKYFRHHGSNTVPLLMAPHRTERIIVWAVPQCGKHR